MKGNDLNDAMEFVGQDLIDMAEKKQVRRSPWPGVAAVAAALALALGLGAGAWQYYAQQAPLLAEPAELSTEPVEEPAVSVPDSEVETEIETELLPEEEILSTPEEEPVDKTPLEAMFPMLSEDAIHFAHPEIDWAEDLQFNYAGLDQEGSDLYTNQGDQVLALDMVNELLLVRVKGDDYQGVLAICKDPTRLTLQPSEGIGQYGQTVGEIAEAHGGILAINASAFIDPAGYDTYEGEEQPDGSISQETVPHEDAEPGGIPAGYTMYDGEIYSMEDKVYRYEGLPYGRIELSGDGQVTLAQPGSEFRADTRFACAAYPPMIVEGELQTETLAGFSGQHPRTCIHPGDNWFYNRENVLRWMGTDETVFVNQMKELEMKGRWVTDDYMAGSIEEMFEGAVAQGKLLCNYTTTIQNHMSYTADKYGPDYSYPDVPLTVEVSPETETLLKVYIEGARDADAMLGRLVDYFSDREEPVVLAFWGDHLPYLGDNMLAYRELGTEVALPDGEKQDPFCAYETPFVIWANDSAASTLDWEQRAESLDLPESGQLSASFLGATLLELTGRGQETPWFSFLNELRREAPVVQKQRCLLSDGRYVTAEELDESLQEQISAWRQWSYYKLRYKEIH